MSVKIMPVTQALEDSFVYSCTFGHLARSIKIPATDKTYKTISVIITDAALQQYALDNSIRENKNYTGRKNHLLNPDALLESYFHSLLSYIEQAGKISKRLAAIKTNEAIELLLNLKPSLKAFLFDFSEPYKIDLEKFI